VTVQRPEKGDTVSVPTHSQYRWLERGEGEAVVLLHGLMGQMHHWDDVLDDLGGVCRAIAPTLPIFDADVAAPSIDALARWVVDFLDAVEAPRAVIGGNSLGGHVALAAALAFPERIRGVILTGSSGLFERSFTRGVPHRPTADYVREKMEEVFFDRTFVTPEWVESVRRTVTERASVLRVLGFARAAKRDNLEARLGDVAAPTLIVWGAEDRITPLDVGRRFHALVPHSRLVILPGCGHAPMLEHPHAFAGIVRRWLAAERLQAGATVWAGVPR
jgi:2-hydroxy-6-oxonona-2,4-dienedioate hydrolase